MAKSPLEHTLTFVGLPPHTEPEGSFLATYAKISLYAMPLAAAVSFARNRDPKWALVHGFMGAYYLGYLVIRPLVHKESHETGE